MSEAIKETDVAAVAIEYLAPQWVEYWPEVPCGTGRADLVGRDLDGSLHAVECKTRPSLALAAQAVDRVSERAFSTVLCVVGQPNTSHAWRDKSGVSDLVVLGGAIGFGVGMVRAGKFYMELAPRPLLVEDGPRESVAMACNDIHRAVASAAGGQSSAYWTLWKQGIHELEQAVIAVPGVNVAALRYKLEACRTLYWRNHNAQIRTMAEQSKKVRAEFTGREYRYYPVESPTLALDALGIQP